MIWRNELLRPASFWYLPKDTSLISIVSFCIGPGAWVSFAGGRESWCCTDKWHKIPRTQSMPHDCVVGPWEEYTQSTLGHENLPTSDKEMSLELTSPQRSSSGSMSLIYREFDKSPYPEQRRAKVPTAIERHCIEVFHFAAASFIIYIVLYYTKIILVSDSDSAPVDRSPTVPFIVYLFSYFSLRVYLLRKSYWCS